jgi:hypothetical protein
LNRWIGPCPPGQVKIENETEEKKLKPRWVNVLADPVSPNLERPEDEDPMHFDQDKKT